MFRHRPNNHKHQRGDGLCRALTLGGCGARTTHSRFAPVAADKSPGLSWGNTESKPLWEPGRDGRGFSRARHTSESNGCHHRSPSGRFTGRFKREARAFRRSIFAMPVKTSSRAINLPARHDPTSGISSSCRSAAAPPRFPVTRARARSTRIRRVICAETAKK